MKRLCLILACVSVPAICAAQPAPLVGTTLTTTSTSADSVHVGCAVGSSTCTGGIKAGPIDVSSVVSAGAVTIASSTPADTSFKLYNASGTLKWNGTTLAIGGSISGTLNTIPVFTAADAIGNSIMTQSGTTITVANTLNATTLGGTLSTASQTNITGVGTLTTGTWNATTIGLAKGGTNADLSATGGTSQFLRQNSVGAAVTVVRPAVSDLSDASNVALLNAANAFTNASGNTFTGPLKVSANDGAAIGASGTAWSDLFLASGAVINFAASNYTITHTSNVLTLATTSTNVLTQAAYGAAPQITFQRAQGSPGSETQIVSGNPFMRIVPSGWTSAGAYATQADGMEIRAAENWTNTAQGFRYEWYTTLAGSTTNSLKMTLTDAGSLNPGSNDGGPLGASGTAWSDVFLASGGVINWNAGNVTLTHAAGQLTTNGLFLVPNGAVGGPAVAFSGDADNGLYYIGTNNWALATGGAKSLEFTTAATINPLRYNSATLQPGFLAYNSADDTTQSTGATVDFDTEIYDEASNFSGDTFTAPVTGRYLFTADVSTSAGSGATQLRGIILNTSNRTYAFGESTAALTTDAVRLSGSVIADMDVNDTATVTITLGSGTVTIDGGSGSTLVTYFSGRLLP